MEQEQKYCVVASIRGMKYNRVMITGPMKESDAYDACASFQKDRRKKELYKYFKVAKYPFKEIK